MLGIAILLAIIAVAIWGLFYNAPATHLQSSCAYFYGQQANDTCSVCVYPNSGSAPAPNCYPVNSDTPSLIAPTWNLHTLNPGPLPLGSLSVYAPDPFFFNIAAGLIVGAHWTVEIAVAIVATGAIIGLLLGAVSGYVGGRTDEVIMRFTDIFLSIPGLLLILVLLAVLTSQGFASTLQARIELLIGAFVITWWPTYARIVRSQVFVTREQKYVEAAKASGAKTGRLLFRHIIPNSIYPVFVQVSLDVGTIPLLIGAIVYLGFHIFPTAYFPEWGSISAQSIIIIPESVLTCQVTTVGQCVLPWWQILFPGLAVFLFAISVNFVADGLRDALDPRLRR